MSERNIIHADDNEPSSSSLASAHSHLNCHRLGSLVHHMKVVMAALLLSQISNIRDKSGSDNLGPELILRCTYRWCSGPPWWFTVVVELIWRLKVGWGASTEGDGAGCKTENWQKRVLLVDEMDPVFVRQILVVKSWKWRGCCGKWDASRSMW